MSRSPDLKAEAKGIILGYLRTLYYKRLNQEEWTKAEETSVKDIAKLERYLSGNEIFKMFVTNNNKENSLDRTEELEKKKAGFLLISTNWFREAVKELEADGFIERKDKQIQYLPTKDEREKAFPILKMADSVPISPLPWKDLAFYKVRRGLSNEIVAYINRQFYNRDIYAVSLGDVIMCIDIAIPNGSTIVSKKASVSERVDECLRVFDFQELPAFTDEDREIGYTEAEEAKARMEEVIEREKAWQEYEASIGGKIMDPPVRDIKKRKEKDDSDKD